MQFVLLLLIFCFVIFLFCVYVLAHDDVVFLRKSITTEQIFDVAFLSSLIGLLVGRILYVVFHFSMGFLNPLVFLLFPYFTGMSLAGCVIGVLVFAYFYTKSKKMPVGRILDFLSVAILCALQFGIFFETLFNTLGRGKIDGLELLLTFLYVCTFLVFVVFLIPYHRSGRVREGTISLLFLSLFSVLTIFGDTIDSTVKIIWFFGYESLICFVLFFASLFFLLKQEKIFSWLQKKLFLS